VAASRFRSLDLELPAVPRSVPRARRAVTEMLEGLDVDLWPVGLVVSEAVTNVVLHAYRDSEPGSVRMEATVAEGVLTVLVADDGIGMSPRADSPGLGVGLLLIRRLAEDVNVQRDDGTRLLVRLRLAPSP
jgi:anti-sigma regulatory factor (Ser/Thr protein kinase)